MRRRTLLPLLTLGGLAACSRPDTTPASGPSTGSATSPSASPSPDPVADLPLEAAAAQLVWCAIPAGQEPLRTDLPLGGWFLLGVWESATEVDRVVEQAGQRGDRAGLRLPPPVIAVDQEGGRIRMLRGDAARETPSAEELGEQGPDAVREAYVSIGEDLAARGIGLALAPVADVVDPELGDDNAPVGELDRGFGTDPQEAAACVAAAVEGLAQHRVGATLKHFPGLGRVRSNTDHAADGIEDDRTHAEDEVLEAFRSGIDAGARAVMVSSAIYSKIDPETPAMFSRIVIEDVLRGRLGWDGLVVTDDIGAAQAVQDVPVAERATRLLDAGGDAVLTADPGIAEELVAAVVEYARSGAEQEQRVRRSASRVLRVALAGA
ncbi:glycoside hydrolase family 3 protein [Brachybacterium sp. EF45031]|uniref:glycoside hydrolase family 3 N-terminal domain-containing protein n=1 Tax=Brachybacterium sillae TaxID=2810536 RepID=UPI00217D5A93|nr:glycoside hydrolase family 3 N-terminal domain-containing protein [Brachybacterium sillae]MCS6711405.1 glycoside hydrolase family 3 protein [Brachybacterium sillae]